MASLYREDPGPDTATSARKTPPRRASKSKLAVTLVPMDAASTALQDEERQRQMRALIQLGALATATTKSEAQAAAGSRAVGFQPIKSSFLVPAVLVSTRAILRFL
jgi:hypothetical protein